jgi:hypothetical protein
MMNVEYKSVSRSFYDELEAMAVLHKALDIAFWNENGIKTILHDCIKDIYTCDGIEHLETGKGAKIRLDKLIEVDGKRPCNQC